MTTTSLRFDGRVAVVTGAGRGLGRAYAELLAARGARVVVNDLGGDRLAHGSDHDVAATAAAEIRAAGGAAVADGSDISTEDGAATLVQTALDAYGRLDIVVNNAGIFAPDHFPDIDVAEFRRYLDVHAVGSFAVTRAAWPHLARAGYGRVVLTTSTGILGSSFLVSYSAAKGAVFSLGRSLADAGAKLGILVNNVSPTGATRLTALPDGTNHHDTVAESPSLAAPLVAYLCHESCTVSGETFLSGARRADRIFVGETRGYVHPGLDLTPEVIADRLPEILSEDGATTLRFNDHWVSLHEERMTAAGQP